MKVTLTAAGTLWVRPEHAGSMATTTTDDILAVYDDAAGLREQTPKVSAMSLEVMDTGSRLKGVHSATCQRHALSAPFNLDHQPMASAHMAEA